MPGRRAKNDGPVVYFVCVRVYYLCECQKANMFITDCSIREKRVRDTINTLPKAREI